MLGARLPVAGMCVSGDPGGGREWRLVSRHPMTLFRRVFSGPLYSGLAGV